MKTIFTVIFALGSIIAFGQEKSNTKAKAEVKQVEKKIEVKKMDEKKSDEKKTTEKTATEKTVTEKTASPVSKDSSPASGEKSSTTPKKNVGSASPMKVKTASPAKVTKVENTVK